LLREALTEAWIEAIIPPKSNRRFPAGFDRDTYNWRPLIENFFRKLRIKRFCNTMLQDRHQFNDFIALASNVIRIR